MLLTIFLCLTFAFNYAQIFVSELVVRLHDGEEVYGVEEIPRGYYQPIKITELGTGLNRRLPPESIEYIILDILVSTKDGLLETYTHKEKRLYIVTIDAGDWKDSKWVYAQEIIKVFHRITAIK